MGLISWIILGLIAGYIAHRLMGNRGQGFLMNTALGVLGAVVGGEDLAKHFPYDAASDKNELPDDVDFGSGS